MGVDMPTEVMIDLLVAKAAELENRVRAEGVGTELGYLAADVALIADLLAEHMRRYKDHHDVEMDRLRVVEAVVRRHLPPHPSVCDHHYTQKVQFGDDNVRVERCNVCHAVCVDGMWQY